ncbi:hypothetical protein F5984_13185 [Rudanella paleaurantiibacter]|uniref:Uncharacterized protein n=1 Tax=Rudanella paleaurantiibacter TaxID=2614655 RepID=A0A7J5TYI4_9BACT|nr:MULTISPECIES: hypothetical protein [Rudanella]KAB7730131.1 hypothetical protein F5984_13185 [Rudanella paleaurantiibacter]
MNELLKQLAAVPPELWYALGIIAGTTARGFREEAVSPGRAVTEWFTGAVGGAALLLIVIGWKEPNTIILYGLAPICGYSGNWALDLVARNRERVSGRIMDMIDAKLDAKDESKPPNNP